MDYVNELAVNICIQLHSHGFQSLMPNELDFLAAISHLTI